VDAGAGPQPRSERASRVRARPEAAVVPAQNEKESCDVEETRRASRRDHGRVETPLGRIGQPNDIALVMVFLASPDSAWTSGETLYISGGLR
jgi:NAD(P)-dependent dehydrogenase (short-subunit alcohol dehydrogenase family)